MNGTRARSTRSFVVRVAWGNCEGSVCCAHTHTLTFAHTHTHTHTLSRSHAHTHTHTHTHTVSVSPPSLSLSRRDAHAIVSLSHTHTHKHTYVLTHARTHAHTDRRTCMPWSNQACSSIIDLRFQKGNKTVPFSPRRHRTQSHTTNRTATQFWTHSV